MTGIAAIDTLPLGAQAGLIGFGIAFILLVLAHFLVVKMHGVKQTQRELSRLERELTRRIPGTGRASFLPPTGLRIEHRVPRSRPQLSSKDYVSAKRGRTRPHREFVRSA